MTQLGAEAVRRSVSGAAELGISYLTLYGFSSENWKRPAAEVDDLMGLLRFYLTADRGGIYWSSQHWLKTVYMGVLIPFLAAWTVLAVRRGRNWFFAGQNCHR